MTPELLSEYRTTLERLIWELNQNLGVNMALEVTMYLKAAVMALERAAKGAKQ